MHADDGGARMKNAEDQLARTLDELRSLAAGLHPVGLDEEGLADVAGVAGGARFLHS